MLFNEADAVIGKRKEAGNGSIDKTENAMQNILLQEIENIVRKYTVDSILNGAKPSIESIHSYCKSEFLYKNNEQRKIGFIK